MIYIKKFIDKISFIENKSNKDVVIPILEARGLRDEISKLLLDLHEKENGKKQDNTVLEIQIQGGSFK